MNRTGNITITFTVVSDLLLDATGIQKRINKEYGKDCDVCFTRSSSYIDAGGRSIHGYTIQYCKYRHAHGKEINMLMIIRFLEELTDSIREAKLQKSLLSLVVKED